MKPDTHTVQQLFERDVRYIVPLYQRAYVWNEEEQWAPLWDDLLTLLEHDQDADVSGVVSHFLGAIVLEQDHTAPGRIPCYTVIDGQQRLTTLQLLVAATSTAMSRAGQADDAELLRELVDNNPRRAKGSDRHKVWPTNDDRKSFGDVMGLTRPPDAPSGVGIVGAFSYFARRALDYLSDDEIGADVAGRAERLRVTISDLLKVVSITLEYGDNAQVIFETLNDRGTPLLSLDLVKNALFRGVRLGDDDTSALHEQVWLPNLGGDYWSAKRRQGRLFRPAGELFLMHWLTLEIESVVPATELFPTFRKAVLKSDMDTEAVIRRLCADAAAWRRLDHLDPQSAEGRTLRRVLGPLDAGTVMPIVLFLFRTPEVTAARRRRALHVLEAWLARRVLMRLTSKNYNRLVPKLIGAMKVDPEHADDALLATLSGSEASVSRWPADAEFVDFLRRRDLYGTVSPSRIGMALEAVEQTLRSSAQTELAPLPVGSTSIEHLMPQAWEANWPLPEDVPDAAAEREAMLNRIGNLTVVASALNPALSNSAWPVKRAKLNERSVLLLNSRLTERPVWNEQAIDERGNWLASVIAAIWPGPGVDSWPAAPVR